MNLDPDEALFLKPILQMSCGFIPFLYTNITTQKLLQEEGTQEILHRNGYKVPENCLRAIILFLWDYLLNIGHFGNLSRKADRSEQKTKTKTKKKRIKSTLRKIEVKRAISSTNCCLASGLQKSFLRSVNAQAFYYKTFSTCRQFAFYSCLTRSET